MDTLHRKKATSPVGPEYWAQLDDGLPEELALGAQAWVDNHLDRAVYTDQPDWVWLFVDALGEVRVAAHDAQERRDDIEAQFWAAVELALGSVLMHQAEKLGIGSPHKYAWFQQAFAWWMQSSPELSAP